MRHRIVISIAANECQEQNLSRAREQLGELLDNMVYSEELWTDPINSPRSDRYLNQIATAVTDLEVDELNRRFKQIEMMLGRTKEKKRLGIVPIDIDLLGYDNQRYHERDWQRPWVKGAGIVLNEK